MGDPHERRLSCPCLALAESSFALAKTRGGIPGLRTLADSLYPHRSGVFALAKPLEGHRMRLHWGLDKRFVFGTKEPHVVEAIQRVVRPRQLAVDVGAHVGYFTLLVAKQVGPSGKVVAFEPNPNIFEILKENVALNGYRNVILENKAVADQPGQVELRLSGRSPFDGIDSIVSDPGPGPRIKVLAVRLDDYFGSESNPVGICENRHRRCGGTRSGRHVENSGKGPSDSADRTSWSRWLRGKAPCLLEAQGGGV